MDILDIYEVSGRTAYAVLSDRDLASHRELVGKTVVLNGRDFLVERIEVRMKATPPRKGDPIGIVGTWV